MSIIEALPSRITTEHRAKLAYVYLRQSSPGQVLHNTESTARQYALAERAVGLGWPADRVRVIDEDLGKSGTTSDLRFGFQQLMTEVGLAHVGLVLSLEAARLARNNSDWYRLIELCSMFGTLIADCERIYDPRIYHDRLLLGLAGMMSEAELHHLKMRLHAGERHKAARGELSLPLPVGLERQRTGEVILHPDEEIQARVRLVFEKFRECGTAKAVMRYLRREGLKLPTRPLRGPVPHEVTWVEAATSSVLNILKNPAYSGAYVYGRKTLDPTRRKPGVPHSGIVRQSVDRWEVSLQDIYPAYISWDEFVANQKRLRANQSNYMEGKEGVARKGRALLQGIALCGLCGARMSLRYSGPHGDYPVYQCDVHFRDVGSPRCQEVRALALDAEIERLMLAALEPDKIALALCALEQLERATATLERQWQLRLERARYEATRAERQYNLCEPENRLVARNLERQWEAKLRGVEEVEREYEAWQMKDRAVITAEDRREILALGEDLPQVWHAPSTTNADRKEMLRLIIKDVVLDAKRARGKVWFQINWQTGAVSEHWIKRRVISYREHADLEQLQQRVREFNAAGKTDAEIAALLRGEGYQPSKGGELNGAAVWHMRKLWGIRANRQYDEGFNPQRWADGTYSVQGVVAAIGIHTSTVHSWLRRGQLKAQQPAKGMTWKIVLSDEQIATLREHVSRVRKPRRKNQAN